MSRVDDLKTVTQSGVIAVVRADSSERLVGVAKALLAGGVKVMEITMTVPGAIDVIREVRAAMPEEVLLGAGTVLDPETARTAMLAGAQFIVGPALNLDVIRICHRYDKLVMPGAFTPTEILTAWDAGADVVKVFPAGVGGASYFKDIRGPLPQVRMMPTGGVNLKTAADFIKAGACCLGVGSAMVDKKAVAEGDFAKLQGLAEQYVEIIRQARG